MTIQQEFDKLYGRLRDNDKVSILAVTSGNTMKLNLRVRASGKTKRATMIQHGGIEVYKTPNDDDRRTCLKVLQTALDGLKLKSSKCYYRKGSSEYYIKPDWDYWNIERDKEDDEELIK